MGNLTLLLVYNLLTTELTPTPMLAAFGQTAPKTTNAHFNCILPHTTKN